MAADKGLLWQLLLHFVELPVSSQNGAVNEMEENELVTAFDIQDAADIHAVRSNNSF